MFGIGLPDALPLFMREFDDGAALAVFGIKVLCEIWPGIVRASALMRSTAAAYSSRRSGFSRERNTVISIDVGSFRKTSREFICLGSRVKSVLPLLRAD